MKTLQESIIGKKGTAQEFLKSNLRPGDIAETRNGYLMIVNGNKFDFPGVPGGYCTMDNYDMYLKRTDARMTAWDIMVVYRPKTRIRSFINLEEKLSKETPIWKRN